MTLQGSKFDLAAEQFGIENNELVKKQRKPGNV